MSTHRDHPTYGRAALKGNVPGWWDGSHFTPLPASLRYGACCARSVAVRRFACFVAGGGLWEVGR